MPGVSPHYSCNERLSTSGEESIEALMAEIRSLSSRKYTLNLVIKSYLIILGLLGF